MRKEDLDCRQREVIKAVLEGDCKILVLGGSGTGKTTTALWCARESLEHAAISPKPRVLFLTFSRSAVSQITHRSPGVISGYDDSVEIMTFHALAYRLLRSFGRYAGYGTTSPSIQSEAKRKLLGQGPGQLVYDDLLPAAIRLLKSSKIRRLISSRWHLIICDEVQDTNKEQWNLLQLLAPRKLLLLGDAHQMIYTFIPGVSPERFSQIRASVDREIELRPVSYRDPSGAIPALAEAIRVRRFDDEAVKEALRSRRLTVLSYPDELSLQELINAQVASGYRKEIGIFAHSNAAVAELADQLSEAGIEHVLVGIPEAHAEALSAMSTQCAYAVGLATTADIRTTLALYLTATVRGRQAPDLARALIGNLSLPGQIEEAISQLEIALRAAVDGTISDLASVAAQSWGGLRITRSSRPWQRAASHFRRLIYSYRNEEVSIATITRLVEVIERSRVEALIDLDYSERGRIRLMNYHQTKGREADVVIHIFRNDDYFGREGEPFEELSRLLNVALSRARERVIVLLPSDPHPLVEPFSALIQDS